MPGVFRFSFCIASLLAALKPVWASETFVP
jgi:hypothetical protein